VQDVKRFKMYRYRCQLLLFIVRSLRDYSFGSPRLDWWLEFPNRRGLYIARCIADCHIANRRAFKGTHAAALSTFAFSACTHAILLIVSGSFVLETSSSCGLVVPMRALPRPMGRHRVPLIFAVDVVVVCPPPSCRGGDAYARKKRNARRFRSDDTIEKMLPLLSVPLSPGPGCTSPSFVAHVMQTVLLGSHAMLVSYYVWTIIGSLGKLI